MAFSSKSFNGASFFTSIRASMNTDKGMFKGIDPTNFRYVILDASFYNLGVFVRNDTSSFTDTATSSYASDNTKRVIANGQFYDSYNYISAGHIPFGSEVIINGVTKAGSTAAPKFRYMGQWKGKTEKSFGFGKGDVSIITSPSGFFNALGRLTPLVEAGTATAASILGSWVSYPATKGKVIYGIHRSSQLLFVIVQEDGVSTGIDIATIQARLVAMKVDYAVLGDGSDSATFVVDGSIEVTPGGRKNISTPNGAMFIVASPATDKTASKLTIDTTKTTDPTMLSSADPTNPFGYDLNLREVDAAFSLTTSGITLQITSWGKCKDSTGASVSADVLMPVSAPVVLNTTSNDLTVLNTFVNTIGDVKAKIKLTVANENDDGSISGDITTSSSLGDLVMNVSWKLKN